MIPVKDRLVDIDSLPGEEIEFGIGDPRWVMKTQADLYSDITTAIIREYSTNAYDAHVMGGNPDPIEVTLPSDFNPYFIVEDKGVGMSKALLKQVYTQFGTSDKRQSVDTNGMLGYGSKSGVAYTTQFTVTTIRDGVRIEGVIQRKPDWRIVLKVVSEKKTDEPSGTRISIPVHNIEEFNHKAKDFYKYWLPGRVLVNGKEPDHAVGERIIDGLFYCEEYDTSYVVMGNVAYRIHNAQALFRDSKISHINFVAYADRVEDDHGETVAAVEFTPSREDLKYTDHTKATLKKIVSNFENEIINLAQDEINNAADHADAFSAWKKWSNRFGSNIFGTLTYKGDVLEEQFKITRSLRYWPNNHWGRVVQDVDRWDVERAQSTVFVTNYGLADVYSTNKLKVREYAKQQKWNAQYYIFLRGDGSEITSPWVPRDKFVDYEDIKEATKNVKPTSTGPRRIAGSWDYYDWNGWQSQKPLPSDPKSVVLYVERQNQSAYNITNVIKNVIKDQNVIVLLVPGNRTTKLLRENPHVTHMRKYVEDNIIKKLPTIIVPDNVKRVYSMEYRERNFYTETFLTSPLLDPMFAEVRQAIKDEEKVINQFREHRKIANFVRSSISELNFKGAVSPFRGELYRKYPLLSSFSTWGVNHDAREELVYYMNKRYEDIV